jgi:hypothetical protein
MSQSSITPAAGNTEDSPAEPTSRPAEPEELVELFQISHARLQSAHYTLFNGHYISVHRKRPFRRAQRYWLNLAYLDPMPHMVTIADRRWLYLAIGLAAATAALLAASILSPTPWHQQAWMPGTILLLNGALVSLFIFFQRYQSLVRFHSRHGDAMLLELNNNSPSRPEFRDFMRALLHRIQTAHREHPHRRLGAELVEHRRLFEAGLIDRDSYDRAREKILRKHRQAHVPPGAKRTPATPGKAEVVGITVAEITRPADERIAQFERRRSEG